MPGVTRARIAARTSFPWSALVAVAFWGASFVAVRIALQAFTPTGLVTLRLLVGSTLLGLLLRLRGGALLPARSDLPRCIVLGVQRGGLPAVGAGLVIHGAIRVGLLSLRLLVQCACLARRPLRYHGVPRLAQSPHSGSSIEPAPARRPALPQKSCSS